MYISDCRSSDTLDGVLDRIDAILSTIDNYNKIIQEALSATV